MEITERQIRTAMVHLDVYRQMRDEIPEDTAVEWKWQDRWRYDTAVRAIESVFAIFGIERD